MNSQTYIPGKDATVEETIDRTNSILTKIGFPVEPVTWLNPAPHCWSVHIRSTDCEHLYTNGKGTTKSACLASGLGEFMERLSTNFFFSDYSLDNYHHGSPFMFFPDEKWFPFEDKDQLANSFSGGPGFLNEHLLNIYDPEDELTADHLRDNNSDDPDRGICCLPFSEINSEHTVYFPVGILNNLYVSNGMAAGNSRNECYSQALSEIIERYVKNLVISKGISLPSVPDKVLKNYPGVVSILEQLRNHEMEIMVKDCSLGGRFPVICVLLAHPLSGGVFAAFGASYRFETAIERTLTELLQGRRLSQLTSFTPPVHDLSLVADTFNLESHFIDSDGLLSWNMFKTVADYPFTPWDFTGSTQKEFDLLKNLIVSNGYQIYSADYTHCGMDTCRIIVPGMSEIYPVDDLLWNNKNSSNDIRKDLLRLLTMNDYELMNFIARLESAGLNDQSLISDLIGIAFDPNSSWYSFSVGELKTQIFLALQKHDEASSWCNWCYDHTNLPPERKRLYRLLYTLLNFKLKGETSSEYTGGVKMFFSEKEIQEAESIIAGKAKFHGLIFANTWQDISKAHNNLIDMYERLNTVKKQPFSCS